MSGSSTNTGLPTTGPTTTGLLGVDSSTPVTTSAITQAVALLGSAPAFWCRYFTSVSTSNSVEYQHAAEDAPLHAAGIRVLPIARQTSNVGGSFAQGQADGAANAKDIFASFGAGWLASGAGSGSYRVFLDVETSHPLSAAYYEGWAAAIVAYPALVKSPVALLPCIYAAEGNSASWTALANAMNAGALCHGVWVAHYISPATPPPAWSASKTTPPGLPHGCPVLLWQYAENVTGPGGFEFDLDQLNPAIDAQDFLSTLILPPSTAATPGAAS